MTVMTQADPALSERAVKRSIWKIVAVGGIVFVLLCMLKYSFFSSDLKDVEESKYTDIQSAKLNLMPDTHKPFSVSFPNGNQNVYSSVNPMGNGTSTSYKVGIANEINTIEKQEKEKEQEKKGIISDAFGAEPPKPAILKSSNTSSSNSSDALVANITLPDPDTNHDGKISESERAEAATQKVLAIERQKIVKRHDGSPVLDSLSHRNILAFGDSLTWGKTDKDPHPYTIKLQTYLDGLGTNLTAVNEGLSGEQTHEMIKRLPVILHNERPAYTIILGGSNDLAMTKISAVEILDHLIQLHRQALTLVTGSHAAYGTLPVTIPQCHADFAKKMNDTARLEVNRALKVYATKCLHSPLLDLGNKWAAVQGKEKEFWSSDLCHFSPTGYDKIADLVTKIFQEWLVEARDAPELRLLPATSESGSSSRVFVNPSRSVAMGIMNQLRNGKLFNSTMC